jgi:hypothetical protein
MILNFKKGHADRESNAVSLAPKPKATRLRSNGDKIYLAVHLGTILKVLLAKRLPAQYRHL